MKRFLCVWLPNWSVQRVEAERRRESQTVGGGAEPSVLLYADAGPRGPVVQACGADLRRQGIVPGLPLAEARSLLPGDLPLDVRQIEPAQDRRTLQRLAWTCQRFSPLVGLEDSPHPECLLLDISGCAHLFGGESGLVSGLVCDLHQRGWSARLAVADTIGAAWAFAHHETRANTPRPARSSSSRPSRSPQGRWRTGLNLAAVVGPGRHRELLGPLPVAALRLPERMVSSLAELDLRRIAQVQNLPRASLPSRFGREILERLDQALGAVEENFAPEHPQEPVIAARHFDPAIGDHRILETGWQQLLEEILNRLQQQQLAPLALQASLECEGGSALEFRVGVSRPSLALAHWIELIRLQSARQQPAGPVQTQSLRVVQAIRQDTRQRQLFSTDIRRDARQALHALVDRLSNRLGPDRVLRVRRVADAQPERAVDQAPWLQPARPVLQPDPAEPLPPRPLVLLCRPLQIPVHCCPDGQLDRFRWKHRWYQVHHCCGPERIETGWWRDAGIRRDYYRVDTRDGYRFWLFQDRTDQTWYLHGLFD